MSIPAMFRSPILTNNQKKWWKKETREELKKNVSFYPLILSFNISDTKECDRKKEMEFKGRREALEVSLIAIPHSWAHKGIHPLLSCKNYDKKIVARWINISSLQRFLSFSDM